MQALFDLHALAARGADDGALWRREVQATIGHLIATRVLPSHLAVRDDEPPIVVRRTLAAAVRRLSSSPSTVQAATGPEGRPWESSGRAANWLRRAS
jgi:hypothetical protein